MGTADPLELVGPLLLCLQHCPKKASDTLETNLLYIYIFIFISTRLVTLGGWVWFFYFYLPEMRTFYLLSRKCYFLGIKISQQWHGSFCRSSVVTSTVTIGHFLWDVYKWLKSYKKKTRSPLFPDLMSKQYMFNDFTG